MEEEVDGVNLGVIYELRDRLEAVAVAGVGLLISWCCGAF